MSTQLRNVKIATFCITVVLLVQGKLSIAGLSVVGFFIGLVVLAKKFPFLGKIVGGLFLVTSPVIAWLLYDPKFFHTEGSPAGLVLPLLLLGFIMFLMILGFSMIKAAISDELELSDDEKAQLISKLLKDLIKQSRKL